MHPHTYESSTALALLLEASNKTLIVVQELHKIYAQSAGVCVLSLLARARMLNCRSVGERGALFLPCSGLYCLLLRNWMD